MLGKLLLALLGIGSLLVCIIQVSVLNGNILLPDYLVIEGSLGYVIAGSSMVLSGLCIAVAIIRAAD